MKIKSENFNKRGFTLIEILVVIGIVSVISSIVAVSLFNYRDRAALRVETGRVVALINETREQSVAGRGGVVHGLHFEESKVVRFSGQTYVADAIGNEPLELSSLVDIGSISLTGGASDVVFSRLSGKSDKTGTFRVRLKSDVANYKEVRIESTGIATVQ